jgi:hypothetical protein
MVKPKLPFEYFDQGGLTGWAHRLDRPSHTANFGRHKLTFANVVKLEVTNNHSSQSPVPFIQYNCVTDYHCCTFFLYIFVAF